VVEAAARISTRCAKLVWEAFIMKYVILIYGNPASRAVWEGLSKEQRQSGLAAYEALDRDLTDSGELVASEALADPSAGRRLPPGKDVGFATDGPFAEVKEFITGFILVDASSMERALEIAARVPEADLGLVEVRPTMDLSAFDL
jgi:hypothetical protein